MLALWAPGAALAQRGGVDPTADGVQASMDRMRAWLYAQQQPDGSWEQSAEGWSEDFLRNRRVQGGETALVTYALLVSGEPYQKPEIERALGYLRGVDMHGVYALSFRMHVWAQLPSGEGQPFGELLEADGKRLLAWQRGGLWDYTSAPREYVRPIRVTPALAMQARNSLSRTQYGALGAWEWTKRGGRVDKRVWEDLRAWGLAFQLAPGGWNYGLGTSRRNTPADGGMTCAGLTLLILSQHHLDRDADRPHGPTQQSIDRGLAWLDGAYAGGPITGRDANWPGVYWYAIERVGQAAGLTRLGGRDWYRDGAGWYLARERGGRVTAGQTSLGSSPLIETAFALAFLSRGDTPLWINKLSIPGYAWNDRPNDVYFLNRFVSDFHERELGWQVVSIDGDPDRWLDAPLMYLTGREALELTDAQAARLKRYLDLGGTLVAVPQRGGRGFERSIRQLGQRLYPGLGGFKPGGRDHPVSTLVYPAGPSVRVSVLSNGVRDLIVLPRGDWGKTFQSDDRPGDAGAWRAMLNLLALCTERGRHRPRLEQAMPAPVEGAAARQTLRVGLASAGGAPVIEPLRFEALRRTLLAEQGIDLDVRPWALVEPSAERGAGRRGAGRNALEDPRPWGEASPDVMVVSGIDAVEWGDAELSGVDAVVSAGCVVLIETIGGVGSFATSASAAIIARRSEAPRAVAGTYLTTGQGLTGGRDVRRAARRAASLLQPGAAGGGLSVEAFFEGDRPAILVSQLDVSLGAMALRRAGVAGYTPETAQDFLTNVFLDAAQRAGE